MGVVRPAAAGEAADHTHALRFTAYEKAAAPSPAAPAPLAAIPAGAGISPVRERPAAGMHWPICTLCQKACFLPKFEPHALMMLPWGGGGGARGAGGGAGGGGGGG